MKLALAQLPLSPNLASNLQEIQEYIRCSAESGADLLVLPEYALSGPPLHELLTEQRAGEIRDAVASVAEECRRRSIAALLPTVWHDNGWYSSAFLIDRGEVVQRHDKAVLSYSERQLLSAGETVSVVDLGDVRYGILLCAEGNGSELLALQSFAEASVILHASAPDSLPGSSDVEGESLWTLPLTSLFPLRSRLRAFGEQVWIASALPAACGSLSRVIAPTGDVVAEAESEEPTLLFADIDTTAFPFRHTPTFARRRDVFLNSFRRLFTLSPPTNP